MAASDGEDTIWSIHQVSRMSGVSARTLRYYGEIGLLRPASVGANGYRYYGRDEVLRLQQILVLRELGLDLTRIAQVIDGEHDRVEALRQHHRRLLDERSRIDRLARTIATTILRLERGDPMNAEEMFDGFRFTPETLADLKAAYGTNRYYEEIEEKTRDWTPEDFRAAEQAGADVEIRLLELMRAGTPPDDEAVFDVLEDDVAAQNELWTPDRESYEALGRAFANAPELRAHLDARDPALADYMCAAMQAYAATRMS